MTTLLVVTDDADRATLEEAITNLRQRQLRCVIPSTADEVGEEIDRLIDWWLALGG